MALTPDRLSKKELAREYGYAWSLINSIPEIRDLFLEAFNNKDGQWTTKKFGQAIKETDWYGENAEYARNAMVAQALGGEDWQADLEEAAQRVQDEALRLGVTLTDEEMADYANRYIFEGWGTGVRGKFLTEALAEKIGTGSSAQEADFLGGASGNAADSLKATAVNNGLQYDDAYYVDVARQIALGMTTLDDAQRRMREEAATKWPTYSEQILAGANARQLASSYINTYAKTMELDPMSISLDDPLLREAMTGVDDKGNFRQMGLWEFEQHLRSKPEWMETKQGMDQTVSVGAGILRRMGFLS